MAFDEVTFFEFHLHGDPNFAPSITNDSGGDGEDAVEVPDGGASVDADADGDVTGEADAENEDAAGGSGSGLGKLLAVVAVLVVVALLVRKLRGGSDDGSFEGVDRIED